MSTLASDQLVDIIREVAQQEIAKRGSVVLCTVKRKKDDDHYDVYVEPDNENIIENVVNMTKFDLAVGDYVYVYKINNQLSNCFVVYKLIPPVNQNEYIQGISDTRTEILYNTLVYVNNQWLFTVSDSLYQKLQQYAASSSNLYVGILRVRAHDSNFRYDGVTHKTFKITKPAVVQDTESFNGYVVRTGIDKYSLTHTFNITEIMNNSLLHDWGVYDDATQACMAQFDQWDYWYKKVGVYFMTDNVQIYETPKSEFITARVPTTNRQQQLTVQSFEDKIVKLKAL